MAILKNGLRQNSNGITHACVVKEAGGDYRVISFHNNVHDAGVNAQITKGEVVPVRYESGKAVPILS